MRAGILGVEFDAAAEFPVGDLQSQSKNNVVYPSEACAPPWSPSIASALWIAFFADEKASRGGRWL